MRFEQLDPLHVQSESSECALACLAICLSRLGHRISLFELKQHHLLSSRGSTFIDIADIASSMGLVCRGVRCEPDELSTLATPAILHWDMNHFVVLLNAAGQTAQIADPVGTVANVDIREVSRHFTGVALELTPAADFKRRSVASELSIIKAIQLRGDTLKALLQATAFSVFIYGFGLDSS